MTVFTDLDTLIAEWRQEVEKWRNNAHNARTGVAHWMGEYYHAKWELVNANKGIKRLHRQAYRRKVENYLLRLRLNQMVEEKREWIAATIEKMTRGNDGTNSS